MNYAVKNYTMEREFPLRKETIWKLLSDNNRLNLYIGLFPVAFSEAKKEGNGVFFREGRAKIANTVPLHWREYPFQWEENRAYSVERRYIGGPLHYYLWGVELFEAKDGSPNKTGVRIKASFKARNALGAAAIPLIGLQSMKNSMKYLEEYLASGADDPFNAPQKSSSHKVQLDELERLETALRKRPVKEEYVALLHDYLIEKSSQDVAHIEPALLANLWHADLDEVLRLLLYATKEGMLNLSWNLICPNCRISKSEQNSLSDITEQFHCDLCGINYDANFDQYVELQFSVHPSVRKAYAEVYCVGGPMITPHVKMQKIVGMGETVLLNIPESLESLRVRVVQANDQVRFETGEMQKGRDSLVYSDGGWSFASIGNPSEVEITNSSSNDIVIVLEQDSWNAEKVTAAKVTAMQEFHDLFSSEVLSPGKKIGIDRVTILFTDLKGSTSLYETVGDAAAYGQVRRHFEFLTQHIAKNSGSVVKTIGDAVMAVFHLPEDGLKAALEIQQNLAAFNDGTNEDIVLKIGLYSGPAIAVNSNDRLDYFGRTVNIAARIEGQAEGGDIVFSSDYMEQANLRKLLDADGMQLEAFTANLKGIEGSVELMRLKTAAPAIKTVG
ncbi:adenylate/guanylate cyclase domain-containing protein [Planococcus ruber]|uniref:adenylate/guanylate cyclase domain-containing protein n=1 Tax=Planococcus ruber TaxID=2027871 RepID=UPI001FEEC57D|nr:adenylate/guanylate cyclase domain-containing protein [Planococcus ruber]MCJ1909800.1 adenylate/guanylate cyclase domain-containing protein [Planococcus ruber]